MRRSSQAVRAADAHYRRLDAQLLAVRRVCDAERRAVSGRARLGRDELRRRGAALDLGVRVAVHAGDLWRATVTVEGTEHVCTVVGEHYRSARSAYLAAVWGLALAVHHHRRGMASLHRVLVAEQSAARRACE